jgi:hypothetical protein
MQGSPCLAQIEKRERQMYFDRRNVAVCDDPSAASSRVGAGFGAIPAGDDIVQLLACALSDLVAQLAYAYEQATRWTSIRSLEAVAQAAGVIDGGVSA